MPNQVPPIQTPENVVELASDQGRLGAFIESGKDFIAERAQSVISFSHQIVESATASPVRTLATSAATFVTAFGVAPAAATPEAHGQIHYGPHIEMAKKKANTYPKRFSDFHSKSAKAESDKLWAACPDIQWTVNVAGGTHAGDKRGAKPKRGTLDAVTTGPNNRFVLHLRPGYEACGEEAFDGSPNSNGTKGVTIMRSRGSNTFTDPNSNIDGSKIIGTYVAFIRKKPKQ